MPTKVTNNRQSSDSPSEAPSDSSSVLHAFMVRELRELFNYRPPFIPKDPSWTPASPVSPLWLYDKHLDENLILRHVKPITSLMEDLTRTVDRTLDFIKSDGINLPFIGSDTYFVTKAHRNLSSIPHATDSRSLAAHFASTTAFACNPVASTLAIHPHTPDWMSWLTWRQIHRPAPPGFDTEGYALRLRTRDMPGLDGDIDLMELLDEDTAKTLDNLAIKFPALAVWQMGEVSDRSEATLRDMDRVSKMKNFITTICRTSGHFASPTTLRPPPDAISTPWNIPGYTSHSETATRRSSRLKSAPIRPSDRVQMPSQIRVTKKTYSLEPRSSQDKRDETILPACTLPSSEQPSLAELIIQHAWTQAVTNDTSIIVFYCGNFERIGIRHRESQTLYLSPIIDPTRCEPAYGKMYVGLFIAAYQDTLDRFHQLQTPDEVNPPLRDVSRNRLKRSSINDQVHRKRSRRKVSPENKEDSVSKAASNSDYVFEDAAKRHLCLARLQYDIFNSISPASFIRIGRSLTPLIGAAPARVRRKYLTKEYFTLIVRSPIGHGTTGITHSATLELTTAENQKLSHPVVVKFAFSEEQQRRMQREYSIYDHMSSKGVRGAVPQVYGLFEDLEGGTMALIMSHAGESLWDRRPNKKVDPPAVSPEERSKFLQAIKSVHEAGVRHNDLRAPNLLINDANEVTIIDFDQADLHSSDGAKNRELAKFVRVLDGDHFKPLVGYISDGISEEDDTENVAYRTTP